MYLKIILFTKTFLNLSVFIFGRWALLFLSRYFVSFFFGMMLLSGQSGSTERTLKSFLSAFSKVLECPVSQMVKVTQKIIINFDLNGRLAWKCFSLSLCYFFFCCGVQWWFKTFRYGVGLLFQALEIRGTLWNIMFWPCKPWFDWSKT